MKNRTKSISNLTFLIAINLLSFAYIGLLAKPEIIFNKNKDYGYNIKFASIGDATYFIDYQNYLMDSIPLYQTDGTAKNTFKVVAKNFDNVDVNIYNLVQIFANNNNLIILREENNKKYLTLLDANQGRVYEIDTIPSSIVYSLKYFNMDSNNTLLYFNSNEYYYFPIYRLDIKSKKLLPYNQPMKYNIVLADNDKLVMRDSLNGIHLLNPNSFNKLWNMDSQNFQNYSIFYFTKGIYLHNKDKSKNSLLVNYADGIVDTIETKKIPTSSQIVNLEYGLFLIYDTANVSRRIIKSDSNLENIDTLNSKLVNYYNHENCLYYFETNKQIFYGYYNKSITMDLYSYNFLTKKTEKLVSDCVYDNYQSFYINKSIDGKIIFPLLTIDYGKEYFVSDGTAAGTKMLKDINPGPMNSLRLQTYFSVNQSNNDNLFYFLAYSKDYGYSVWKTDGTSEETIPIFSLEPTESELTSKEPKFYVNKNKLFIDDNDYLFALEIEKIDKIRKVYDYKIIDNIFAREYNGTTLSHFYQSSFINDKENNFYVTGQHDCNDARYTFCYSKDQSCDTIIRYYRTIGYIIKYNQNGERLFTKYIDQYMFGDNIKVAVDSTQNIYCLSSNYDVYNKVDHFSSLTKYNSNGDSLWNIKFYPREYIGDILCLETDKNNNVYALFSYKGFAIYNDEISLSSKVSPEYVLFKISPEGKILSHKQFNHTTPYSKVLMSIVDDNIFFTFSSMSERGWSSCKYQQFQNMLYKLDSDLNVLKQKTFVGDDFNYISSIQKGFGEDILITGIYRGQLYLMGNDFNSDMDGECNLKTSYYAILDNDLNVKYVKDFNPEKYLISSAYLTNDNNILTTGTCSDCKIDTTIYPDYTGYKKYSNSISTRKFDYWGNELASFNYSKSFSTDDFNLAYPMIIELNNKPLISDVYDNRLGLLPELSQTGYIDFLLLLQPELIDKQKPDEKITSKYSINYDYFGNSYIKQHRNIKQNETVEVSCYDLRGKLIESKSITLINGIQQIDFQNKFSKGVYILTIKDGEVVEQHKLIK